MGSHCQCSDSMCGHGFCNPELDNYTIGDPKWKCSGPNLKIYYEREYVVDELQDDGYTYKTYYKTPTNQELFDTHGVETELTKCSETTVSGVFYQDADDDRYYRTFLV